MPDKTPLQLAKEALDSVIAQKKLNQELIKSLGPAIIDTLKPILNEIAANSRIPKDELLKAISNIKIPEINIPKPNIIVNAPDLPAFPKIPEPKVIVNVPPIKIPEIKMPDEMDIKGWVQLQGVDIGHPLPVQLRDKDGKVVNLLENLTTIVGGSGGGSGMKINKISDIANSAWANLLNSDGRLRMSAESGSTGLTDTELRASSVPVSQASGATWSVSVNDSFRTTVASNLINSDDRLRVSVETGGSGLTDTELRAVSVPVAQVSGAVWSIQATDIFATTIASNVVNPDNRVKVESVGTQIVSATDLDIRDLVNATDSVSAYQVSGANWSVSVTGMPATTIVMGDIYSDVADVDSAPIKTGGIARQANPTAVEAGDRVSATYDDLGRAVTRPVQVRDLIQTAYVAKATGSTFGTETTLLASASGVFSDLIYVMGTNDSDVAIGCDFRSGTANGIVFSLRIPANGTAGVSLSVPIPQDTAAATWTIDLPDVTGTNVNIAALFSLEV